MYVCFDCFPLSLSLSLYRQSVDDSWSEGVGRRCVDPAAQDWLMRALTAAVSTEQRRVHFDPNLSEAQLIQLIDDELSVFVQPQRPDSSGGGHILAGGPGHHAGPAMATPDDQYVDHYVSRLRRFVSNIDYFLQS